MDKDGTINDKQFGFCKEKSTTDAISKVMEIAEKKLTGPLYRRKICVLVALYKQNVFNSERWETINETLLKKGIPQYLIQII